MTARAQFCKNIRRAPLDQAGGGLSNPGSFAALWPTAVAQQWPQGMQRQPTPKPGGCPYPSKPVTGDGLFSQKTISSESLGSGRPVPAAGLCLCPKWPHCRRAPVVRVTTPLRKASKLPPPLHRTDTAGLREEQGSGSRARPAVQRTASPCRLGSAARGTLLCLPSRLPAESSRALPGAE